MKLNMQIVFDFLVAKGVDMPVFYGEATRERTLTAPRVLIGAPAALTAEHLYVVPEDQLAAMGKPEGAFHCLYLGDMEKLRKMTKGWDIVALCVDPKYSAMEIFDIAASAFEFYGACSTELMETIVREEGIEACLKVIAKFFDNPVILFDSAYSTIAVAKEVNGKWIDEKKWHSVIYEGHIEIRTINSIGKRFTRGDGTINKGAAFGSVAPERYYSISGPILVDDALAAFICIPDDFTKMSEGHLDLADYCVDFLSTFIKHRRKHRGVQHSLVEQFACNLLAGAVVDEKTHDFYLSQIGWSARDRCYLLKIAKEEGNGELVASRFDLNYLKRIFDASFAFIYEQNLLVIANCRKEKEIGAGSIAELDEFLRNRNLYAGISTPFEHFSLMPFHYRMLSSGIDFGRKQSPAKRLIYNGDFFRRELIMMYEKEFNPLALCHTEVLKLFEYDRQNGTVHLDSMHAYITHERSLLKASEVLNVHRNTLSYRLEKIADIIDVDYNDPGFRYHSMLSYDILRYTDPKTIERVIG